MLLHREKSSDTNLHPFLFRNTEALKHKKEIDLFGLILVVIQMCLCFPFNDDTRGKDTEAWDTSSCNGPISGGRRVTISGELDPTQEALIRAKPNLIHPRDANALNAIDYMALRHTEEHVKHCLKSSITQGWGTCSTPCPSSGSSFLGPKMGPRWKKFPGTQPSCTTPSTSSTAHQLLPFADWQKCRTKVGLIIGGYHQHIEDVALQVGTMSCRTTSIPFKLMSCNISLLIFPIPSSRVVLDEKYASLTFES